MRILFAAIVVLSFLAPPPQPHQAADVIFINGDVYPGAVLPYMPGAKAPSPQRAQAIAVKDGHILTVGTNDDVKKLHGGKTRTVDLGGHFAMPGLNDAHVHLAEAGQQKLNVDLVGVKSLDEMK